jgi:hypothetical protein
MDRFAGLLGSKTDDLFAAQAVLPFNGSRSQT